MNSDFCRNCDCNPSSIFQLNKDDVIVDKHDSELLEYCHQQRLLIPKPTKSLSSE